VPIRAHNADCSSLFYPRRPRSSPPVRAQNREHRDRLGGGRTASGRFLALRDQGDREKLAQALEDVTGERHSARRRTSSPGCRTKGRGPSPGPFAFEGASTVGEPRGEEVRRMPEFQPITSVWDLLLVIAVVDFCLLQIGVVLYAIWENVLLDQEERVERQMRRLERRRSR
jgi:hypothetical protein